MFKPLALMFLLVALVATTSSGTETVTPAVIVAKVGNTPITVYEINRETQRILPLNVSFHGKISDEKIAEVKAKALTSLIDQSYKVEYALQQKLTVSKEELDVRLKKVRSKFTTDSALQKALGTESLEDFYASVVRILLAKKGETLAVNAKVKVSEGELLEHYEQNKKMYNRPKQYRASDILIKVDPTRILTEKEPLRLKAEKLAEQAKNGEDFYNLAYYNSDDRTKYVGGDIGYFHSGQIDKELEEAIKDLIPGDIAGPIDTLVGFHIIKLTEVNEPRQLAFAEVKVRIRKRLEEKKHATIYGEWLGMLKKSYQQEIF